MSYITITYPGQNWAFIEIDAVIEDRQSPEQLAELNLAINQQMDLNYLVKVTDKNGVPIGSVPRTRPE